MIVGNYLKQQALKQPDKTAVICNDIRLSYFELNQQADRLAQWLLSLAAQKFLPS